MLELLLFVGIIMVLYLLVNINKGLNTSYFFRLFLLFSFIIWYLIPIILSLTSYWEIMEIIVPTSQKRFIELATFEVWFYAIILLLFNNTKKKYFKINIKIIENPIIYKFFEPTIILFTIWMLVYNFIYNFDYNEVNEIDNAEGGFFFLFNAINIFILSFIWINIILKNNIKYYKVYLVIIILYLIYYILSGSRIYLIGFIWLFYFVNRDKIHLNWLKFLAPILLLSLASLFLLPILASKRVGEDTSELVSEFNISDLVLSQLNIKLNSIAYSSVLLEKDGIGFAGINPYVGSLLKFLPRGLWADKPTPTSFNGNISGVPSRRIPYLLNGTNGTYNVGVSAGIVALWQGYYSVILTIILNVLLLHIISKSLVSKLAIINAIGFMLFLFPQLIMTPSFGDNIIQRLLEAVFILILLLISGFIKIVRIIES